MTKWNCSISATPPRIASPSSTTPASSESTSQPMLQTAPSRNDGSRPRAKNLRSTRSSPTVAAARISQGSGPLRTANVTSYVIEGQPNDGINGEQLQPFVPRRLPLVDDVVGDQDREEDRAELEPVED